MQGRPNAPAAATAAWHTRTQPTQTLVMPAVQSACEHPQASTYMWQSRSQGLRSLRLQSGKSKAGHEAQNEISACFISKGYTLCVSSYANATCSMQAGRASRQQPQGMPATEHSLEANARLARSK